MYNDEPFFYGRLTTEEIKQAVQRQLVVLIPIGSIEAHGNHLPIDTDCFIAQNFAVATARRIPDQVLVAPLVPFTFDSHFMDYPGTIAIQSDTLIKYLLDITCSIAHHGFKRIVFVNGHGTNVPFLTIVSHETALRTDALCAQVTALSQADLLEKIRKSAFPGGISHAGEGETSLVLHLDPDRVQMDKATEQMDFPKGKYFWRDVAPRAPIDVVGWWSAVSETGTAGDPTVATAQTGQIVFDADVDRLIEFVKEFQTMEWPSRKDRH